MSKYHNQKTTIDGINFDSKREAERWCELKIMQRAGIVTDLKRQVKYCLIPEVKGSDKKIRQRAVHYIADFVYWEKHNDGCWHQVVEDAKGIRTEVYKIKKKLMLWRFGIEIREV